LNDYEAFIEKLLYLIENENKRQEMSQKGWPFVEEKFQYTTLIAKIDSYYKLLLNQKNICA
jgi:glycosyltransferase involved in cell wall biosynthesis